MIKSVLYKKQLSGLDTATLTAKEVAMHIYGSCTKKDVANACNLLRINGLTYKKVKTVADEKIKQQVIEMAKNQPLYLVVRHFFGDEYQRHYAKMAKWVQKAGIEAVLTKKHTKQRTTLKVTWDAAKIEMVRAAAERYKKSTNLINQ